MRRVEAIEVTRRLSTASTAARNASAAASSGGRQMQQRYYEGYWEAGLTGWSPVGMEPSPFEQEFMVRFIAHNSKVLDFGCGDGSHAGPFLLSHGCSYTGLDISTAAVAMCRAKGLEALEYSPDAPLPFANDSFDSAVSFEVFEHLFSPHEALGEIHRILRPGGYLIGSVPNAVSIGNRLLMTTGQFSPGGSPATSLRAPWKDPHIRFFSKRSLLSFLNSTGFRQSQVFGRAFSLMDLPVLYKSAGFGRRLLGGVSEPLASLGKWWPSLCSATFYFAARK